MIIHDELVIFAMEGHGNLVAFLPVACGAQGAKAQNRKAAKRSLQVAYRAPRESTSSKSRQNFQVAVASKLAIYIAYI